MVTVSSRNDEYFAMKVSHDGAPHPIKYNLISKNA